MKLLLFSVIFLVFLIPLQVFAQPYQATPNLNFDLGWKVRTLIDDFRDDLVSRISEKWGAEVRTESTLVAQEKLEQLLLDGKPVPEELFQRVQQKFEQVRPVGTQIREELIESVTIGVELNEIRKVVSDFQSGNYEKSELQARINALDSVKQKCTSVPQVSELETDPRNAYQIIQDRYCPVLKTYSAESALKILNRQ